MPCALESNYSHRVYSYALCFLGEPHCRYLVNYLYACLFESRN
jgi:hypothetical protein